MMAKALFRFIFIAITLVSTVGFVSAGNAVRLDPPFVYLYISIDCPISQKLVPDMKALYEQYSNDVFFVGIVTPDTPIDSVAAFKKAYGIPFDLERDTGCVVSNLYDIKVVPQAVLLNENKKVVYKGAIDNSFAAIGKRSHQAHIAYLQKAIEALLANKSIETTKAQPIGCVIRCKNP